MKNFDLEKDSLSSLNLALQSHNQSNNQTDWRIVNPRGQHAIAVGLGCANKCYDRRFGWLLL